MRTILKAITLIAALCGAVGAYAAAPITTSFQVKVSAIDPTVNDDTSLGYIVGIGWKNTTTGHVFVVTDVSDGAAVWEDLGSDTAKQDSSEALTEWAAKDRPTGDVLGTTDAQTIEGKVISAADNTISGSSEAYGAGWEDDTEVPDKAQLFLKIESLGSGVVLADADEKNAAEALKSNDRRLRGMNTAANINTINPMTVNITLSTDDSTDLGKAVQVLFSDSDTRKVILPATGDSFIIFNTATTFFHKLNVRDSTDATTICLVYGGLNAGLQFVDADGAGGVAGGWVAFVPQLDYREVQIFNPAGVQATSDDVPIFWVDELPYPNGITLLKLWVKTDSATSYSVVFNEYSDPATLDAVIETVATSASMEASDPSFANTNIAAGNGIVADLDGDAFTGILTLAWAFFKNP